VKAPSLVTGRFFLCALHRHASTAAKPRRKLISTNSVLRNCMRASKCEKRALKWRKSGGCGAQLEYWVTLTDGNL